MKNTFALILFVFVSGCTSMHYKSKNTIPVTFSGNPKHQKEVWIEETKGFYFWGLNPENEEIFVDEVVRKAGYDGLSKLIIYEEKKPQDVLISFLTFGIYLPRTYTITGFASGEKLPDELEDSAPPSSK